MSFLGMNLHFVFNERKLKRPIILPMSIWFGNTFKIIRNSNNSFDEFYEIKYWSKNDNVKEIKKTVMMKMFGLKYFNIFTHKSMNHKLHKVEFS